MYVPENLYLRVKGFKTGSRGFKKGVVFLTDGVLLLRRFVVSQVKQRYLPKLKRDVLPQQKQ